MNKQNLKVVAHAINRRLKEAETSGVPNLYGAHAYVCDPFVVVTYVSYEGKQKLTLDAAKRYLAGLIRTPGFHRHTDKRR